MELFQVHHHDQDVQRRGRNVIAIGLMSIAIIIPLIIVIFFISGSVFKAIQSGFLALPVNGLAIWLAQRGRVNSAATLVVFGGIFGILAGLLVNFLGSTGAAFFLLIPLVIAGITYPPRWVFVTLAIVLVAISIYYILSIQSTPELAQSFRFGLYTSIILTTFIGLTTALGASNVQKALSSLKHAQQEAEQTSTELARLNQDLDQRVVERTQELETAMQMLGEREASLSQTLADLQASHQVIREINTPVIPLRKDIMVVPLIGSLDSERTEFFIDTVLQETEHRRARYVILDITGVPVIDTFVAKMIIHLANSINLLGAYMILVGIRPEVAQTLVSLQVNFSSIKTYSSLQAAIEDLFMRN